MNKISIATFQGDSRACEVYGLWQYDYGQVLRIQDLGLPAAVEIHFSLSEKGGSSITRVGTTKDGVTDVVIPDSMLENGDTTQDYWIYAFVYLTDADSGNTEYKISMKVKSRPRPEAIDRPEDQELFREAIAAVNDAADRAENAVKETEEIRDNLNADVSEKVTRPETAEVGQVLAVKEIDENGKPTVFEAQDMVEVPEWAQKPEKPSYTAGEVGALPADTKIPIKVSELENDSGYLTEHQDVSGKLDADKLPEAIDTALTRAKESGAFDGKDGVPGEKGDKGEPGETTYIENPYDDTELKSELATKITAPENPEVGKVFKIKSVNEDGTFIGEWADGGVNLDVQIDGRSIVKDGVANIPHASSSSFGIVKYLSSFGISTNTGGNNGYLAVMQTSKLNVDNRANAYQPIVAPMLDYAVKAAMTDGKGAAWTADEQAAARERMGIDDYEDILDVTLEEDSSFSADFEHEYRKLYIYIDQSGVEGDKCATIYFNPYSYIDNDGKKINSFSVYELASTNFYNIGSIWESFGKATTRISFAGNPQHNSTGNMPAWIKFWDTSIYSKEGVGAPFKGIYNSPTVFKSGTRIVIKGVRA